MRLKLNTCFKSSKNFWLDQSRCQHVGVSTHQYSGLLTALWVSTYPSSNFDYSVGCIATARPHADSQVMTMLLPQAPDWHLDTVHFYWKLMARFDTEVVFFTMQDCLPISDRQCPPASDQNKMSKKKSKNSRSSESSAAFHKEASSKEIVAKLKSLLVFAFYILQLYKLLIQL